MSICNVLGFPEDAQYIVHVLQVTQLRFDRKIVEHCLEIRLEEVGVMLDLELNIAIPPRGGVLSTVEPLRKLAKASV